MRRVQRERKGLRTSTGLFENDSKINGDKLLRQRKDGCDGENNNPHSTSREYSGRNCEVSGLVVIKVVQTCNVPV